jgi:hypothetical protein
MHTALSYRTATLLPAHEKSANVLHFPNFYDKVLKLCTVTAHLESRDRLWGAGSIPSIVTGVYGTAANLVRKHRTHHASLWLDTGSFGFTLVVKRITLQLPPPHVPTACSGIHGGPKADTQLHMSSRKSEETVGRLSGSNSLTNQNSVRFVKSCRIYRTVDN